MKNILRIPKFYRVVPLLVFCLCIIIDVCILVFKFEEWPYAILCLAALGVPFLMMFVMWSLWKIEIKDDGFLYRNFLGKKVEYKYIELEYREHPKGLKWYFYKNNKKVLCIAYYIEDGDRLSKLYNKYLKRVNKNQ